jgi:hypothetical protein
LLQLSLAVVSLYEIHFVLLLTSIIVFISPQQKCSMNTAQKKRDTN